MTLSANYKLCDDFGNSTWNRPTQILVATFLNSAFLSFWMMFMMNSVAKSSVVMKICGSYPVVILSRLSFSLFMLHPVFVIFMQSQQHDVFSFSQFSQFMSSVTVLMISLPFSLILALLVESPAANLLRFFTEKNRDSNVNNNDIKKQS